MILFTPQSPPTVFSSSLPSHLSRLPSLSGCIQCPLMRTPAEPMGLTQTSSPTTLVRRIVTSFPMKMQLCCIQVPHMSCLVLSFVLWFALFIIADTPILWRCFVSRGCAGGKHTYAAGAMIIIVVAHYCNICSIVIANVMFVVVSD